LFGVGALAPLLLPNNGANAPTPNLVPLIEEALYLEARDESREARNRIFGVPIARDLRGVIKVQDGIKNRLDFQTRRESAHAQFFDEAQFGGSNGTEESHA